MLGSIGATTISSTLGGGVLIDATDVRWMPYDTGSGTVPAIGTSITQGGVTGYLLGVWTGLNAAPTAVGAAMPATGFIKFREVTGGPFSAGALTGIGASATGPDVTGWIEVVQDQSVANTVPRLGSFVTRGDWFYLDNTTGVAGQVIQVPTNGGGSGTHVPAVWIETAPGSDTYEIYPAVLATWFLAANLSTDVRAKFVETIGTGQIRIGQDGAAANAGYVPVSGCKVRIPNILGRQTSAANRAANLVPHSSLGARPDFTTASAGEIDFEYFMNDWYHVFASPYKVRIIHAATFDIHTTANEASPTELEDYATGSYNGTSISLTLANNQLGGTITDCKFYRAAAATSGNCFTITSCSVYQINNMETGVIQYARSTGAGVFNSCVNIDIDGLTLACAGLVLATVLGMTVDNFTYIDRLLGTSDSTAAKYAITTQTSCDDITIDGVSFGPIADVSPYSGLFTSTGCTNLTVRNAGTFAAPLDVSGGAVPGYIFGDGGSNDGIRVQRCYLEATRLSNYLTVNTSKNITIENCKGTVGSVQTLSVNTLVKGIRTASNSVSGGASVYGSHWFDLFESDTQGRVWLAFNEPTAFSADQYQNVVSSTGFGFTSAGNLVMPNLADEVIWTMPYFCIGHTAFDNSAPVLTGTNTGNFTITYDIDTGSGFSGSYSTLSGANLSAETIDPAVGFKLKIRIVVATANASNALTYIRVTTDSTAVAQQNNLYPLDYSTISLTGLVAGSRVQLYDVTNDTEIYNEEVAGTSLTYETPYVSDFTCRVRVMKMSGATAYKLVEFSEVVGVDGFTRAVSQEADTIYATNGIDGSTVTGVVIDDANLLLEVDTGTISWASIYAYETYWLFTEEGIRDESRFIEAVDPANYRIFDFKIKNVSSPSEPLVITGGYGVDGDTGNAIDIIDTTGGTIFSAPEHVVAYETSGGGGATAADIWAYSSRTLTSAAAPTAAANASAVRTELATELGRIDVAISTRLAGASYTAPLDSTATQSAAAAALSAYDPPTATEMNARTLASADYATSSALSTVDTVVDSILVDTDELQTNQGNWLTATPWTEIIEDGMSAAEIIRVILAVQAGKSDISGSTITFRDQADTKDRVTATMSGSERTAVILDGS